MIFGCSITSPFAPLHLPLLTQLYLRCFFNHMRWGVVVGTIVGWHGHRRRLGHKGVIVGHLRRRCMMVVFGAGIRSVSLTVKAIKRLLLLSQLLTSPRWVAVLHLFSLGRIWVRRRLLRWGFLYFPLFLLLRLARTRRTIIPCIFLLALL